MSVTMIYNLLSVKITNFIDHHPSKFDISVEEQVQEEDNKKLKSVLNNNNVNIIQSGITPNEISKAIVAKFVVHKLKADMDNSAVILTDEEIKDFIKENTQSSGDPIYNDEAKIKQSVRKKVDAYDKKTEANK